MPRHNPWTRDELLIALRLYMRTPFGRLHRTNPEIVTLAGLIRRTPSALGMKACNFASLDPRLEQAGLSGASAADRAIWEEFFGNPEELAVQAEEAYSRLVPEVREEPEIVMPAGETEVERVVRARRVQSFFRAAVLVSYESRCAVTGLAEAGLLVASHIIPWNVSVARRADPRNGICLNAIFDRAFDRGLVTVDSRLRLVVSARLREADLGSAVQSGLAAAEGRELAAPQRFGPDPDALAWHRENVLVVSCGPSGSTGRQRYEGQASPTPRRRCSVLCEDSRNPQISPRWRRPISQYDAGDIQLADRQGDCGGGAAGEETGRVWKTPDRVVVSANHARFRSGVLGAEPVLHEAVLCALPRTAGPNRDSPRSAWKFGTRQPAGVPPRAGKRLRVRLQKERLTLEGDHFYIDLVFYHTILKCFVLIDLKTGKLTHQDLGQLQLYVNYYDQER